MLIQPHTPHRQFITFIIVDTVALWSESDEWYFLCDIDVLDCAMLISILITAVSEAGKRYEVDVHEDAS